MEQRIRVEPLPYKTRQKTFLFLLLTFVVSLPFLYLYATGYRFDLKRPTTIVSTGGMYVAVDRTGAEIYIDNELVRETRTFRKAFYAQSLDIGTHRVHVQKEGHHTWVKELPVSKHLVTEAQAFNLPLVPNVRVISQWKSATGTTVVYVPFEPIASSTNELFATTSKNIKLFVQDQEYVSVMNYFGTTSTSTRESTAAQIRDRILGTGTTTVVEDVSATTTIVSGGVKLFERGDDVYASWVGPFEQMPYYYCAADFPPYSTSSTSTVEEILTSVSETLTAEEDVSENAAAVEEAILLHPLQTISKDTVCDPTIRIDRKWQTVSEFDFYPGSTDFVILAREDGIYIVEVDDRAWQNVQSLMRGKNLKFHIENGTIYVFDGIYVYQIISTNE